MSSTPPLPQPALPAIGTAHHRRLRAVWQSAGWAYQDMLELDLLAAGLLQRQQDAQGRETVRLTDAGLQLLHQARQKNRAALAEHEQLVAQVAQAMQRAGRVVWRGLSLRARIGEMAVAAPGIAPGPGPGTGQAAAAGLAPPVGPGVEPGWAIAMPDVYSIRHTTVEDQVEPVAHEIKVRRADLLADLRRPGKGEAYRWLSSACWYVLRAGIAQPDEIPDCYGVLLAAPGGGLEVARPAPRRPMRLPFMVWMALARATPERVDEAAQPGLAVVDDAPAPGVTDPADPAAPPAG